MLDNLYDVDTVQPLDPARKMPTPAEEFIPLRVVAYINPAEASLLQITGLTATPIVNESWVAANLYCSRVEINREAGLRTKLMSPAGKRWRMPTRKSSE